VPVGLEPAVVGVVTVGGWDNGDHEMLQQA
jgi:hypothetical protein